MTLCLPTDIFCMPGRKSTDEKGDCSVRHANTVIGCQPKSVLEFKPGLPEFITNLACLMGSCVFSPLV